MGDGLPTDARIEANLLREAVRLREASHMRRRGQSESGVDATCCIPFREGDGSSYGIHRGKLVDGIGDMRGANDHRGCLRALVGTKFGNLLDFDMGGRVGYSPEEEAGTSGEPGWWWATERLRQETRDRRG